MPTTEASGTQAATVTTEHSLATVTTAKVLVFTVDVNALVGGATPDIVELRIKRKVLTGGTARQEIICTAVGGLVVNPIVVQVPAVSMFSCEFTLKQTQGTGRSFDWSVVSL